MIADPKRKPHQDDGDSDKRRRQEEALDEALKNTFPASDPVSVEQPRRAGAPVILDPCPFRKFYPAWIRVVRQNHRITTGDCTRAAPASTHTVRTAPEEPWHRSNPNLDNPP